MDIAFAPARVDSGTLSVSFLAGQTLSAASATLLRQRPGDVFIVIAIASALHLLMLAAMHVMAYGLRLHPRERVAVVIMSSQKSAPVAVTVITYISRSGAQQGLLAIPALVGQLTQIFIGSALARNLAKQVQLAEENNAPQAEDEGAHAAEAGATTATRRRLACAEGEGDDEATQP